MQRVIAWVVEQELAPAWNSMTHEGAWRHLIIRDAGTPASPRLLVSLVTSSAVDPEELRRVGAGIAGLEGVESVLHVVTDGVAEVARGELREVLAGEPSLSFQLGAATLKLPHDAFFQVNTRGAELLVETIAEAAGLRTGGDATLVDLYCGVGAIGLALADRVARVVGVELHEGAILRARENARDNGVAGEWHAGTVEALLPGLDLGEQPVLVVDPPRAGTAPRRRALPGPQAPAGCADLGLCCVWSGVAGT